MGTTAGQRWMWAACVMILSASLASPVNASWRGTFHDHNPEPNTGHDGTLDTDAAVMWQRANAQPQDRIYFDFFTVTYDSLAYVPHVNPEGSAVRSYLSEHTWSRLGFWRDCNADGYIGSATTGAVHYPTEQGELEAGERGADPHLICPSGSPYQDEVMFNEFLAIGPDTRDASNGVLQRTLLCPERHSGPAGPHGGPGPGANDATPRASTRDGVLDGGDNLHCSGYHLGYVQDDYAKVWADIGFPTDRQKPTSSLLPLPDGTLRDTNGAFRYVDGLTLGLISRNALGLWPAAPAGGDPAPSGGCQPTEDASDAEAVAGNALAWEGPGSCSPVPNVRYATLPVLGPVAWPGHLLEDRSNSSEAPHEQGRAITAPFDQAGPEGSHADQDGYEAQEDCELKHDLDTWDDEHGDGDPLAGWDSSDPTDLSAYHGPGDQGPSLDPTLGNIWAALAYQVERAIEPVLGGQADCNHADTWIGPWETSGSSGLGGLKTQTTASFSFDTPTTFNPSHAPGGPAPDTYLSPCEQGWYAQDEGSLYCGGAWEGTSFLDVPNEPPGAYLARTARWTAYADVSFQIPDFDPAGDGRFRADPHGVWDAPAGLDVDPARVLPAGSNDAHQYGDAQCDAIEALPTGGDLVATGTPGTEAATPGWSCQREAWMHASGLDCSRIVDERACWADVFVGAPFDLRDVECRDNDVAATSTTDAAGPLGPVGTGPDDNLDCVHR